MQNFLILNEIPHTGTARLSKQRPDIERRLRRVRRVASMLDDQFKIPGTRIRWGIDSLVGLLPGAGDLATAAAGLWLIGEAVRMQAPKRLIARMLWNLLIDSTLGSIPILGDVFDLFWKSNRRNVDLLENHLATKEQL